MKLQAFDRLGNLINQEVTRLVLCDDYDNPVFLAMQISPNINYIARLGDDKFEMLLKLFGIDKTVVLNTLQDTPTTNPPIIIS